MLGIVKPKLEIEKPSSDGSYAKFVVEPLERGMGITLGNSLRRVLLSSLQGVAVTSIKIDGVQHEFSTIPGVKEDVTEIVLNIKSLTAKISGESPKTLYIEEEGPKQVTASDIKTDSEVEILNGDLHIATLEEGAKLYMEVTIDKGRGYDKVIGLDSGADDYVTKPFGMMELVSRIKAVLRRSGKVEDRIDMELSGVRMDIKKHEVTVDGKQVALTLKEFELLEKLMRNQGIVLTRDQLLTEIWGYDFDGETRTVDVHIRTLRQKLGAKGEIIQTVRGVGYRVGGAA